VETASLTNKIQEVLLPCTAVVAVQAGMGDENTDLALRHRWMLFLESASLDA